METRTKDFEYLYRRTLLPSLLALEPERQALQKKIILIGAAIVGSTIFLLKHFNVPKGAVGHLFFISLTVVFMVSAFMRKSFRKRFKHEVLQHVFKALVPDGKFEPESHVSQQDFDSSELFGSYNRYKGEDRVTGTFLGQPFEFSELSVSQKTGTGKNRRTHTVFQGVFFQSRLNRSVNGTVLIRPDTAEKAFGQLVGRFFQKSIDQGGYPLVELESPDFETLFTVRSDSQQQARVLLSPAVMERLTNFSRKYPQQGVHVSIRGSSLRLALTMNRNLFEPRVFGKAIRIKDFEEITELFKIIEDLAKALH